MKSFVEQSERHYVSVPRHHLWSRIYIILRVIVSHICHVYVPVCSSMCSRVYGSCMCACLRVLRYSCVFSLVFSLSFLLSRVLLLARSLSLFLFYTHIYTHTLSLSLLLHILPLFLYFHTISFLLFLSCSFRTLSHTRAHTFFPPAFLSLPVLLYNISRTFSSSVLSRCADIFACVYWTCLRVKEAMRDWTNRSISLFESRYSQ